MANHTIDINGQDSEVAFGLFFETGVYQELLKLPAKKTGLQFSWPDEDGTDIDEQANFYESRDISLSAVISAESEELLLAKYKAFGDLITSGQQITLGAHFLNREYVLRYVSVMNTKWEDTSVSFVINLIDDYPTTIKTIN